MGEKRRTHIHFETRRDESLSLIFFSQKRRKMVFRGGANKFGKGRGGKGKHGNTHKRVDAPPATTESIRAQVEFYFSDSNLPADSFLMSKINDAKEDEGFVDLRTICTFTRMKEKLKVNRAGLITQEMVDKVAASLQDSATVAVRRDPDNKNKVMVKRITKLMDKEENVVLVDSRSVLARPFPMDSSIEDVRTFFANAIEKRDTAAAAAAAAAADADATADAEAAPKVVSVRFRRHEKSKDFDGTLFVEFGTTEDAQEIVRVAEATDGVVYAGMRLTIMPKAHFCNNVLPGEIEALKAAQQKEKEVADKLAEELALQQKQDEAAAKKKKEEGGDAEAATANGDVKMEANGGDVDGNATATAENGGSDKGITLDFIVGTVIRFNVCKPEPTADAEKDGKKEDDDANNEEDDDVDDDDDTGLSREDVREAFEEFGEVVFVSFSRGASFGHVQFKDPTKAAECAEKIHKKEADGAGLKCGAASIELKDVMLLTGDEETQYWKKVQELKSTFKERKRAAASGSRGGARGKGWGGRGGGRPKFKRHSSGYRGGDKKRRRF